MAREVTLVDAGLGTVLAVERALLQIGVTATISDDPDKVAISRLIIFPGYSALDSTIRQLVDGAMGEALRMVIRRGDPFLAIDVGMQLLFDGFNRSQQILDGLHILPGVCQPISPDSVKDTESAKSINGPMIQAIPNRRIKVPHVGWNEVEPTGEHFYFSNDEHVVPSFADDVLWTARHGSIAIPAAVRRENIFGCQFRPEISQRNGLRFLRSFLLETRN